MMINRQTAWLQGPRFDTCGFLNANEGIKWVIGEILEEYLRAKDKYFFPDDVVHAAAIVSEESGELVRAANNTYYDDTPEHRLNLLEEAVQTGAMAIRFFGAYREL